MRLLEVRGERLEVRNVLAALAGAFHTCGSDRGKKFGFVRTADYMIFSGVKYIPFHKTAKSEWKNILPFTRGGKVQLCGRVDVEKYGVYL